MCFVVHACMALGNVKSFRKRNELYKNCSREKLSIKLSSNLLVHFSLVLNFSRILGFKGLLNMCNNSYAKYIVFSDIFKAKKEGLLRQIFKSCFKNDSLK